MLRTRILLSYTDMIVRKPSGLTKTLNDFYWGGQPYQQCIKTKAVTPPPVTPPPVTPAVAKIIKVAHTRPGNWIGTGGTRIIKRDPNFAPYHSYGHFEIDSDRLIRRKKVIRQFALSTR